MGFLFTAIVLYIIAAVVQAYLKTGLVRYFFLAIVSFVAGIFVAVPSFNAVRSFSSNYINFPVFNLNFTFVLDNIAAPVLLFTAISVFLTIINCNNFWSKDDKLKNGLMLFSIASGFAVMTSVNAVLLLIYLEGMIFALMFSFQAGKKYFIFSQVGIIFLVSAFIKLFLSAHTIEFGRLAGQIEPVSFSLIFIGLAVLTGVLKKAAEVYKGVDFPSVIFVGFILPIFVYVLIRFLFLWQTPETFVSYLILVAGIYIVYCSVKQSFFSVLDFREFVLNISYKNVGFILISMGISMFGMILKNLPVTACAMFALYFALFNQIMAFPALFISVRNKPWDIGYHVISESAIYKFLPQEKLYTGLFVLSVIALPPFTAFAAFSLFASSVFAGVGINNFVLAALFSVTLVFMFVMEALTVKPFSGAFLHYNNYNKSFKHSLLISGFIIILVLAGLFPHIAVEFFVAPVFIFCGANLYVPQVMLNNLSIINISLVLMFLAFYLLRCLFARRSK